MHTTEHQLHELEAQLAGHLTALQHHKKPLRDVNVDYAAWYSALDRLALAITTRVGTFGFFLIIFGWTVLWLGWNLLAPSNLTFDPAPAFVLWLFISNTIQILLMPLIMVGQNLLSRHGGPRAENDFAINQKAEREVETILLHLEHQAALLARQGELVLQILDRLDSTATPPVAAGSAGDGVPTTDA